MFENILKISAINYFLFNIVYYLVSGALFLIDYFGFFQNEKIQKNSKVISYYIKCAPCVIFNTIIGMMIPSVLTGIYDFYYDEEFNLFKCIFDLFFSTFLTEISFYTIHRILHIPYLYQLIHKKHHQIIAPIGFSAAYMSIADLYIGNILPISLPMLLINAHPITIKIWIVVTTINTIIFAHSGYEKIAIFHDKHHSLFNKNYGTNLFMDKMFKTHYTQM